MGSSWNLLPAAVRGSTVLNRVLTSAPGIAARNFVRTKAKAIAAFVAPLIAARVAGWLGYTLPLPILVQLLAAIITAATVYVPANKPPLTTFRATTPPPAA